MSKRPRDEGDEVPESVPKKIPKIFDGKFFKPSGWDGQSLNITAVCQICEKPLKGQFTSTGNYTAHYKYE